VNERAYAEGLSEALGGLPLAHELAVPYCDRVGLSLAEYQKRFDAEPARLLNGEKIAPAQYHNKLTVAKTFSMAIEEATTLHKPASDWANRLRACSRRMALTKRSGRFGPSPLSIARQCMMSAGYPPSLSHVTCRGHARKEQDAILRTLVEAMAGVYPGGGV
jgi:hypothetical protein